MTETAIGIKDLAFGYKPSKPVVTIQEFSVAKNTHTFLHGPSGAGKSTLLSLIAGILTPQSGTIEIFGETLSQMKAAQRDRFRGDHMGYIFQQFNLLPYLSVEENIFLPLTMSPAKKNRSSSPASEIDQLLDALNIGDLKHQSVGSLSIGQQQRVAAARSFMGQPKLIIADDPTSSLDFDNRKAFIECLFEAAKSAGATILFVSHDHSLSSLFDASVSLSEINRQP